MDLTPPPDWGKDSLTDFFDHARRNGYASFLKRQEFFKGLVEVDSIFRAVNMDEHPLVYPALMLLENALYAFFMRSDPERIKIWAARHDSPEARTKVRKTFQWADILHMSRLQADSLI